MTIKTPEDVLGYLLLTLNRFHRLFCCFCCWFWTSKRPFRRHGKTRLNTWPRHPYELNFRRKPACQILSKAFVNQGYKFLKPHISKTQHSLLYKTVTKSAAILSISRKIVIKNRKSDHISQEFSAGLTLEKQDLVVLIWTQVI